MTIHLTVRSNNVQYRLRNSEEVNVRAIFINDATRLALLECFQNVAWINENGQTYYENLIDAMNNHAELVSISAVYTQSGTVYDTDSLDSLKSDLVVTATYSDSSTVTVPGADYTLSGSLTVGTSIITVSHGGKSTTFSVTVTYSDIIYNLPETAFDGTFDIVTEIQPLATDTDISFVVNFQGISGLSSANWRLFDCWSDPSNGVLCYVYSSKYTFRAGSQRVQTINYNDLDPHTLIVTHTSGSNLFTVYLDSTTAIGTATTTTPTTTAYLAFGRNTGGQYYKGTVSSTVYDRVLSSSEIAEIMGS